MNIRRVRLDVDWAVASPGIADVAEAISQVPGVEAANVSITEIDLETIGSEVIVEGTEVALRELIAAIERAGAVVHSVDQLAVGERVVDFTPRHR